MSVHPTTKNTLRGLLAAGTILLTSFGAIGVAAADGPSSVTPVDGNPNCASVGAGYSELKIDPVPQDRTSRSGFRIDVSGRVFDWASIQGVDVVIVKGGPNALVYRYSPEATSGTGLHAPVNPSNGGYYGLSHISFCVDRGEDTPVPEPPTCPEGEAMNSEGECVAPPKPPTCPEGESMNGRGECVVPPKPPTCTAGESRNDEGECVGPPEPPACTEGQEMSGAGECFTPRQEIGTPPPVVLATTPVATSVANRAPAPAVSQVLGATGVVVGASARMQGPKRCVVRPFRQVLRGQGIKRVTMYVNGRKVKTMSGRRSSYPLLVDPRRYRSGVVRITAKVEYLPASGRRAQTLSVTALRCARGAVLPRFTG